MENKVLFTLGKTYFAPKNEDGTYGTPINIPGGTALELTKSGDMIPFYAEGIIYTMTDTNNGYAGSGTFANITEEMNEVIWKMEKDSNDVEIEKADVQIAEGALLYTLEGDKNKDMYCLYDCFLSRPNIGGNTKTETKEPQTRSFDINCIPLPNGKVKARTTSTTAQAIKDAWFTEVYESPPTPSV